MVILGIETTCDETAASIIKAENNKISVLSDIVSSQIKLHAKWGGIVPNLAAREHLKNIIPVLKRCFKKSDLDPKQIDLISVASGPGLIPALLIGVNAAKTLSYIWRKPLIGIHHIEGHIYANFIHSVKSRETVSRQGGIFHRVKFPILCLVVSGGHTQLVLIKNHLDYKIIGETLDDAAGEAFDKVARILGLGYPGGPIVSLWAAKIKNTMPNGRQKKLRIKINEKFKYKINLPRPMINSKDFNFSFSGLKTAVLYETKKHPNLLKNEVYISEICHEFQQAACDVLISKTIEAAKKYRPKTVMLAGGVSANQELRNQLGIAIKKELKNTSYRIPEMKYCVDNATMIATAGFYRWKKTGNKKKLHDNWKTLSADANLKL